MGLGPKGAPGSGLVGPRGPMTSQQTEMERALSAGMGLSRGMEGRSPFERGAQYQQGFPVQQFHQSPFERSVTGDSLAREFQQQFHGSAPATILGPRGHIQRSAEPWIDDFQRMNLRGNAFAPSLRSQAWAHEMARGPPPELDRAWRERNVYNGNAWATELAEKAPVVS